MNPGQWLELALSNAVYATFFALGAAAIEAAFRRPRLVRLVWLVVLLRLIVPFSLPYTWPGSEALRSAASGLSVLGDMSLVAPVGTGASMLIITLRTVLVGLWMSGILFFAALAAIRIRRLEAMTRTGEPPPSDWKNAALNLATRMGDARVPDVVVVRAPQPPMLWVSWGKAFLLVPAPLVERLDSQERDTLIAHELAHLNRKDHWVRYLELVARCLFWWFPVVYLACRRLRWAEELCCDAEVTRVLSGHRRAYALCLLKTMRQLADNRPDPLSGTSGLSHVHEIKERITMIMLHTSENPPSPLRRILVSVAAALFLLLPPGLMTYAHGQTTAATGVYGGPVSLEIRLAKDVSGPGFAAAFPLESGKTLYLSDKAAITNHDIATAKAIEYSGSYAVEFELTPEGAKKLRALTRDNIEEKLAIVLNGKVVAAPVIKAEISERGIIDGKFTEKEARDLARALTPTS